MYIYVCIKIYKLESIYVHMAAKWVRGIEICFK